MNILNGPFVVRNPPPHLCEGGIPCNSPVNLEQFSELFMAPPISLNGHFCKTLFRAFQTFIFFLQA